jgi:ferrous iron transport protein B
MNSSPRIKVVLIGNPNVGKSLIFSRLTGVNVISANYPGTTVVMKVGRCRFSGQDYEVVDMPGLYSLDASSTAEQSVSALLAGAGIIVNIIDATTLERNLTLTLQLLRLNKPTVVCLNIWDETIHKGIAIDVAALEQILDIPVVSASAMSGRGINDLVSSLSRAHVSSFSGNTTDTWQSIGAIVTKVQKLSHRHHTFLERLSEISLHPLGGPIVAIFVLAATFVFVRSMGEGLINSVMEPLFSRYYHPFLMKVMEHVHLEFLRDMLLGLSSDPLQSFGILTTGVYIALVLVFPYFFSFYLLFGLLEDFGYLPRLAVVLDALFHRLGLHGYSSIPVMLGLGCKVPALLATRTLVGKREKVLTIMLVLMSAPCLPQTAMIFSLGMHYGVVPVMTIFVLLFLLSIVMNLAVNRLMPGEISDLFMEIPGYRIPSLRIVTGKLWTTGQTNCLAARLAARYRLGHAPRVFTQRCVDRASGALSSFVVSIYHREYFHGALPALHCCFFYLDKRGEALGNGQDYRSYILQRIAGRVVSAWHGDSCAVYRLVSEWRAGTERSKYV